MKLYVTSKVTGAKMHILLDANVRNDLRRRFNGDWFTINDGQYYNVLEVFAEPDTEVSNTAAGSIIGGLVGLLGGPIGLIVGAGIGGAIGNSSDNSEIQKANRFNNSR